MSIPAFAGGELAGLGPEEDGGSCASWGERERASFLSIDSSRSSGRRIADGARAVCGDSRNGASHNLRREIRSSRLPERSGLTRAHAVIAAKMGLFSSRSRRTLAGGYTVASGEAFFVLAARAARLRRGALRRASLRAVFAIAVSMSSRCWRLSRSPFTLSWARPAGS
jgi:hypothetical protein